MCGVTTLTWRGTIGHHPETGTRALPQLRAALTPGGRIFLECVEKIWRENKMRIVAFAADRADDALFLVNLLRLAPIKLSEFLARESRWPLGDLRLRWLGYGDERAVAYGEIAISPYNPADHLAVQIAVEPDHRGCGRGSDMLDLLEREANGRNFRGLVATIPEAASRPQAWAKARGFRRHALHSDSLLDLRTFHHQADVPTEVSLTDMTGAGEPQ